MPITQALQLPAVSPSRMPPLLQTTWTSGHQSPAVDTNEEYNVTRTTASYKLHECQESPCARNIIGILDASQRVSSQSSCASETTASIFG